MIMINNTNDNNKKAPKAAAAWTARRAASGGAGEPTATATSGGAPACHQPAGLLCSWDTCQLSSLLPQVSLSCSGARSSVQPILLGYLRTRDPTVLPLVPRLTRLRVALAQSTASRPIYMYTHTHIHNTPRAATAATPSSPLAGPRTLYRTRGGF